MQSYKRLFEVNNLNANNKVFTGDHEEFNSLDYTGDLETSIETLGHEDNVIKGHDDHYDFNLSPEDNPTEETEEKLDNALKERLISMTPWKRLFEETRPSFDLGEGFILKFVKHEPSNGKDWWTVEKDGSTAVTIQIFPEEPRYGASVDYIHVGNQYRNLGLGRKVVRSLANHYGSLSSSLEGETSPQAEKMWISLGAKKVPSGNHNGFVYKLFRQKGNLN